MKDLTDRQQAVFSFINEYLASNTYPPTIREIGDRFGISVKGAYDHVKAIEKKGYIKSGENRSRTISVLRHEIQEDQDEIPLIGTVAAGKPVFADENFQGTVSVPRGMVRGKTCFALRVRGDSMRDAGILSGDLAVIESRQSAENGEIVVAIVDDSATLKRYFREPSRVRLMPENPDYPPIYTQDARVIGKLRGIVRNYE